MHGIIIRHIGPVNSLRVLSAAKRGLGRRTQTLQQRACVAPIGKLFCALIGPLQRRAKSIDMQVGRVRQRHVTKLLRRNTTKAQASQGFVRRSLNTTDCKLTIVDR